MSRHLLDLLVLAGRAVVAVLERPAPIAAPRVAGPIPTVPAPEPTAATPPDPFAFARAIVARLVPLMEGRELRAYLCPAGVWTIGYGTIRYPNGVRVAAGDTITAARALELMHADVARASADVARIFRAVQLSPARAAALVLFCHNMGGPKLTGSSMASLILAGRADEAGPRFDLWCKAADPKTGQLVPLRGLQIRRRTERLIFEGVEPSKAYARAQADFPRPV